MGVIGWILFGLVVGIVAKFLMPGRDPGGFIVTILLGVAGALLGGYLGRAVGWYQEGDPVGFLVAVLGAIILLALYRLLARRSVWEATSCGGVPGLPMRGVRGAGRDGKEVQSCVA